MREALGVTYSNDVNWCLGDSFFSYGAFISSTNMAFREHVSGSDIVLGSTRRSFSRTMSEMISESFLGGLAFHSWSGNKSQQTPDTAIYHILESYIRYKFRTVKCGIHFSLGDLIEKLIVNHCATE